LHAENHAPSFEAEDVDRHRSPRRHSIPQDACKVSLGDLGGRHSPLGNAVVGAVIVYVQDTLAVMSVRLLFLQRNRRVDAGERGR
jgi:hypothetical protein